MDVGARLYMYDVVVKRSRSLSYLLMSSCQFFDFRALRVERQNARKSKTKNDRLVRLVSNPLITQTIFTVSFIEIAQAVHEVYHGNNIFPDKTADGRTARKHSAFADTAVWRRNKKTVSCVTFTWYLSFFCFQFFLIFSFLSRALDYFLLFVYHVW